MAERLQANVCSFDSVADRLTEALLSCLLELPKEPYLQMMTDPELSPLAHPRKIAKERILIAAGAGDRIVPPEHPSALWEHWQRPAIHWFRGAHTSTVASRELMRLVKRHLRQLDIL